jgi:hypothetical protein
MPVLNSRKINHSSVITTHIPNIGGHNIQGSPNAVTIQSKVYVCGSSIAGIVGPNPAGSKNVLLSCFLDALKAVDYATS